MADLTDYLENAIMNWMRGTVFPAAPANVYVGLYSSDPTETGTAGTEVTTTIRAAGRLPAGFAAISGGQITNAAEIDFGNAAGGATITHMTLHTAASAGNMLARKTLAAPNIISVGNNVKIPVGSLVFKID